MEATLVLLAHKRLHNMRQIAVNGRENRHVREVLVWDNTDGQRAELLATVGDVARIIGCGYNTYTLGRFLTCSYAKTAIVATCDDDVLVENWDELLRSHRRTGLLACNLNRSHVAYASCKYEHHHAHGTAYETLLGWGAVFRRSWCVSPLVRYGLRWGVDETMMRKADRIFTILLNREHYVIQREPRTLPGFDGPESLYRRKDHWTLNKVVAERCRRILNESHGDEP